MTRTTARPTTSSADLLRREDVHLQFFDELQHRFIWRQLDAVHARHSVHRELGFGRLKRPGQMMNLHAMNLAQPHDVQAVTLGNKVLKLGLVICCWAGGPIVG